MTGGGEDDDTDNNPVQILRVGVGTDLDYDQPVGIEVRKSVDEFETVKIYPKELRVNEDSNSKFRPLVEYIERLNKKIQRLNRESDMKAVAVSDDSGGVRGRREIEEKLEELEERHGTTVGDDEYGVVIHNEEERMALEWVLGVRDHL